MASTRIPVTISSLIKQDFPRAYFLPNLPSSYCSKEYKFLNDKKYRVFDNPPWPVKLYTHQLALEHLATAGSEVPFLADTEPQEYLKSHWKRWLPQFAPATIKPIDEGLADDVPIVTRAPFQSIPASKHAVDPDTHYKVQLKSTIPKFKVPCPRYMAENDVTFPCLLKVDISWNGLGHRLVNTPDELQAILTDLRENNNWNGGYILQEYIKGIKNVPGSTFYLNKAGEVTWLGTNMGGFSGYHIESTMMDWDEQDELREAVYDEFVIPIKEYLHQQGYFGFVVIEVIVTEHGRYLCDLNPRNSGDICQILSAPFMAEQGYTKSSHVWQEPFSCCGEKLVAKADEMNRAGKGRVLILTVVDTDDAAGCYANVTVFAKSYDEVKAVFKELAKGIKNIDNLYLDAHH